MDVHGEQNICDRDYIPAKVAKVDTGIGIHKVYVEHEKAEGHQEDQIHGEVIEEEVAPGVNDDDDIVEYIEEYSYGQVVRDDNGQFYVVMDKETPDFGFHIKHFEKLNNVQIILNDDGSKTLLLEDIAERELLLNANDPSTSAVAVSKDYSLKSDQMVNVGAEGGEGFENEQGEDGNEKSYDRGLKQRRSRVYGSCKCPECDQAFVNTARLERHLAVHQVFGSFLCPLCGKTYKYEYNLFYHWRRTCRDMNELITVHERKNMEVTNLRQLVEEIAQKKQKIGPLDLGISNHHLYRTVHNVEQFDGRRTASCKECGVTTLEMHLPRHYAVHRCEVPVDEKLLGGGYFCDLCGLMFRQHSNLIKHWRTGCLEINDNLPRDCDLALDDTALKAMVFDLMKKATANVQKAAAKQKMAFSGGFNPHHHQLADRSRRGSNNLFNDEVDDLGAEENGAVVDNEEEQVAMSHHHLDEIDGADGPSTSTEHNRHMISSQEQNIMEHGSDGGGVDQSDAQQNRTSGVSSTSLTSAGKQRYMRDGDNGAEGVEPSPGGVDHIDVVNSTTAAGGGPGPSGSRDEMDERWAGDQGMIFADDLIDDEDMLMINDDGQLCSVDIKSNVVPPPESSYAMPGPMEMTGGYGGVHPMQQQDGYGAAVRPSQAVQCYECFRSFANMARLERHMAGAHSSYGTHHCILCGNRFKYDYNLLYHYRRSCPYTKAMIETDVREQLDAISLKKLIRTLASKENRLASAAQSIGIGGSGAEYGRSDLGDSMVRRQMIRSVMPSNSAHTASGTPILIPPASAQSSSAIRPGMEGKKCPICSIMFYGANVLMRHLRVAHPGEYELFEPEMDGDEGQEEEEEEVFRAIREDHHIPHQHGIEVEEYVENEIVPEDCGELDEPPPTLHPEPEVVDDHATSEELSAAGMEMSDRGGVGAQRLPSGGIYG